MTETQDRRSLFVLHKQDRQSSAVRVSLSSITNLSKSPINTSVQSVRAKPLIPSDNSGASILKINTLTPNLELDFYRVALKEHFRRPMNVISSRTLVKPFFGLNFVSQSVVPRKGPCPLHVGYIYGSTVNARLKNSSSAKLFFQRIKNFG